jgi:Ferritin-like
VIEDREELILMLSEAASLEHMVMCGYLYSAFSMRREGLAPEELESIQRWNRVISEVAVQEMLHLALVNNLLTSVGAAPHLMRPNFPVRSKYFGNLQMALMPFGEEALRHSLFLERPDDLHIRDAASLRSRLEQSKVHNHTELLPSSQDYGTIGDLYREIEKGLAHLAERYGEERLFVGSTSSQATRESFGWQELVTVRDLKSANDAVSTIIIEGEGARGDWKRAHFGRLLDVHDEYAKMKSSNPRFEPAYPVIPAYVQQHTDVTERVAIVSDPFTLKVAELFNSAYGTSLEILSRFFIHVDCPPEESKRLASSAMQLMTNVIKPLGQLMATLPVGRGYPGKTAGPAFEVLRRISYILPHRKAAWVVLQERLDELANYSAAMKPPARAKKELEAVTGSLKTIASEFGNSAIKRK